MQVHYDCSVCISRGLQKKRQCFHPELGDEVNTVPFTSTIKDSMDKENPVTICTAGEEARLKEEDILGEYIPKVRQAQMTLSALQALRQLSRSVCPKSFMTQELIDVIQLEWFSREYHVPPYPAEVGLEEYPNRLLEAFAAITTVRESYKERQMKKASEGK